VSDKNRAKLQQASTKASAAAVTLFIEQLYVLCIIITIIL